MVLSVEHSARIHWLFERPGREVEGARASAFGGDGGDKVQKIMVVGRFLAQFWIELQQSYVEIAA